MQGTFTKGAAVVSDVAWMRDGVNVWRCAQGYVVRAYSPNSRARGWHPQPNGDERRIEPHWAGMTLRDAKSDVERYGAAR